MKNKSLFKLLLSVFTLMLLSSLMSGSPVLNDMTGNDDIIISHKPSTPPTFPHAPSIISISAYYDSEDACIYTSLSNAGLSVDVEISNYNTAETYLYAIPGTGSSILPISGNAGIWTITYTLSSGDIYEGTFVIL